MITKNEMLQIRKQILEREFSKMNEMQQKAVFQTEGPLLILAGAGSGKTTVLVNRIANIIRNGDSYHSDTLYCKEEEWPALAEEANRFLADGTPLSSDAVWKLSVNPCRPWQILAITFTNKAAGELKNRLCSLLGEDGNEIWASTFHSTCARILRRDGERLGFTNHFTIYDTDDSRRLMKECLKTLRIDDKTLPVKAILNEISCAKDEMQSPADYAASIGNDYRLGLVAKAYKLYQARLREADAMDFDDLLFYTVELLQTCPDVLEYYQDRFRYIMVDEYQDTNHVQYVFVRLLSQKHGNICVVGDDDQSIYKFRGATIENILSFESTFPNAKVIRLEQNYRSTQNILDAANAVIANNAARKGKNLWTNNGTGVKIAVHTANNEQDEADYIARKILDNITKGRSYSDHAILYRMNSQSNSLERVFVKSGIRYKIIGGLRFYERKEIKDMIAYLSVISNPTDEIRLRRIINQPKRSIGDKTIATASEIAVGIGESLYYVISHADEFEPLKRSAGKLLAFSNMMNQLIDAANDPAVSLEELYQLVLEKTDYIAYLRLENDAVEDRIDNINELASNLIQYEEDYGEEATLSGFLEEVSLMTDIDQLDSESDAAVMMTMHAAKGLEFPVVFLPGLEEGVFPGMQTMFNPDEVEEERRLAYVAITRAKEELHILNAESRMIFGSTSRNKPSRFLLEIPDELTDVTRSRSWGKPVGSTDLPFSSGEFRDRATSTARSFGPVSMEKKPSAKFAPGDKVLHKAFGEGMILSAQPMGNDTLLEIAFASEGTKKIMANFARLKKLS